MIVLCRAIWERWWRLKDKKDIARSLGRVGCRSYLRIALESGCLWYNWRMVCLTKDITLCARNTPRSRTKPGA